MKINRMRNINDERKDYIINAKILEQNDFILKKVEFGDVDEWTCEVDDSNNRTYKMKMKDENVYVIDELTYIALVIANIASNISIRDPYGRIIFDEVYNKIIKPPIEV